nr:FAD-dependent oxidoreductase [Actinomycetales bacterium]
MPSRPDVLIIGGGLAASALVTALRARGFTGAITVAGAEEGPAYDRPPLTKQLLTRTTPSLLSDQFGVAGAEWRGGLRATSLTPLPDGGASVSFDPQLPAGGGRDAVSSGDHGSAVSAGGGRDAVSPAAFPRLDAPQVVLATGAGPVVPRGWDGVSTISTWEDAAALRQRLAPGARLGIVGAGWLGLELASSAAAAGGEVTVLDMAPAPLGQVVPPAVSSRVARWL